MESITTAEAERYYRAALVLLGFVEGRQSTQRRFGGEADALWSQLRGDLTTADRIDLLLRDADVQWPGAFGARSVFALGSVADDEPFGAEWPGLEGERAEELWRACRSGGSMDLEAALRAIALAWKVELGFVDVPAVDAAERLVVAGPSAVAALVGAFAGRSELDWSAQVIVVATPPGHRQLAAAAGALLNATTASVLLTAQAPHALGRGVTPRVLVSTDADPQDAAWAGSLAGDAKAP